MKPLAYTTDHETYAWTKLQVEISSFDFFPKSLPIGQKSSKTVVALDGKPNSAYPFRPFLLSLGPTYGQDITSKAFSKLVTLPRQ